MREKVGLRQIRKKRLSVLVLFFLYIPAVLIVWFITRSESATTMFAIAWMVAFAIAAMVVSFSRCPRCDKYFHLRRLRFPFYMFENIATRRCLNCDLRLVQR